MGISVFSLKYIINWIEILYFISQYFGQNVRPPSGLWTIIWVEIENSSTVLCILFSYLFIPPHILHSPYTFIWPLKLLFLILQLRVSSVKSYIYYNNFILYAQYLVYIFLKSQVYYYLLIILLLFQFFHIIVHNLDVFKFGLKDWRIKIDQSNPGIQDKVVDIDPLGSNRFLQGRH